MPFRQRPEDHLGPLTTDAAVHDAVGQMVRQFADALAFLRELVQNSLDADATAIEVLLDHYAHDGAPVLEVSVRDDGKGMDRETMERCLLVLFRSSKEGDPSRIGKFGVGFFSVFAAAPDLVTVESGTSPDADAVRLLLRPDFTWEMEAAAPRKGTVVRVRIPLRDKRPGDLADACVERLRFWCGAVRVPLHARLHGIPGRDEALRIDAPHAIESPVQVRHESRGALTLVGLSLAPRRRYLNRGLLIQSEDGARDPEERGLAWLIDAPDLHHTISRDAVVRDAAFAARARVVRELAHGPLRDLALRRWRASAARCAEARHRGGIDREHGETLAFLARALPQSPLALAPGDLHWPLAEPHVDDGVAVTTRTLAQGFFRSRAFYTATTRGALTEALARRGEVVLDIAPTGDPEGDAAVRALLGRLVPGAEPGERAWVLLRRVTRDDAQPLLDALRPLALAIGLGGVLLCDPEGSGAERLWYSVPRGHDAARGDGLASVREDRPFAYKDGGVLLLRASHPDVQSSVAAARRDPRFAALALLRLALLGAGALDAANDDALFARYVQEAAR